LFPPSYLYYSGSLFGRFLASSTAEPITRIIQIKDIHPLNVKGEIYPERLTSLRPAVACPITHSIPKVYFALLLAVALWARLYTPCVAHLGGTALPPATHL